MSDGDHDFLICHECGTKYGSHRRESTWHMSHCDWCGEFKAVTEPRDYGYPKPPKIPPIHKPREP